MLLLDGETWMAVRNLYKQFIILFHWWK